MKVDLLKQYLAEVILVELSSNGRLLSQLRQSGLSRQAPINPVAGDWVLDQELASGREVAGYRRSQAHKFAQKRWPALLQRYHGDQRAAEHTLYNLLSAKFN
jgi:hypothetical protein